MLADLDLLLTVVYCMADDLCVALDAAYAQHPERLVRKPPAPPELPTAAWINKPDTKEIAY